MYEAKIKITKDLLFKVFPAVNKNRGLKNKTSNIDGFVYVFNKYADYFGIDTVLEVRHFIAQTAHESDQFNAYEEYSSGSAYEGRRDLGNIRKGDGVLFKGRGPFQITGRKNYEIVGNEIYNYPFLYPEEKKLFQNNGVLKNPKLLQDSVWGTLAALQYWVDKDLNSLCVADGKIVTIKRFNGVKWYNYSCSPIEAITRKINGGVNGLPDRIKMYNKLKIYL